MEILVTDAVSKMSRMSHTTKSACKRWSVGYFDVVAKDDMFTKPAGEKYTLIGASQRRSTGRRVKIVVAIAASVFCSTIREKVRPQKARCC